jgi:chromosome segregation ATPase
VHRAGDTYAEAQERARQLEAQLHELGENASRAIERLQEQAADLHQQLEESEGRRAHAEEGLQRLCTAIREHFSGPGETKVARTEHEPERLSAEAS